MLNSRLYILVAFLALLPAGASSQFGRKVLDDAAIAERLSHLAPALITADTSGLAPGDRSALRHLIGAARLVDSLYLVQLWDRNLETLGRLREDTTREGAIRLRYFLFNMGPWSRSDGYSAFLPDIRGRKPIRANLYPAEMKRSAWGTWFLSLDDRRQRMAMGRHHVIRGDGGTGMTVVPYSEEFRNYLGPMAVLLREAAASATDSTLRTFLTSRAAALLSDDYAGSEMAWLSAGGPLDVTVGPYDLSVDEFFSYKAAFEAYIGIRHSGAEEQLRKFAGHLGELASILPGDSTGTVAPPATRTTIRVADAVYLGGGARAGFAAGALNYPIDTAILNRYGDKKVIFRNIQKVKFDSIQIPLAGKTIAPGQVRYVTFDAFIDHMMMHELVHDLGPRYVRGSGGTVSVRDRLSDLATAFDEAKADVAGLWALRHLTDIGALPGKREMEFYATHLSSMVRALRFGMVGGPGAGTAIEYNYLKEAGAFGTDPASGLMKIDPGIFRSAVRELLGQIVSLQAAGDYARCREFYAKYAFRPAEFESIASTARDVPFAIEPLFPLAD